MWLHFCIHRGIEDIFKALRRQATKGENDNVNLHRLYDMAAKAGRHAYPDVMQQAVDAEDVVAAAGRGKERDWRKHVLRLGQSNTTFGMANYMVQADGHAGCHIHKAAVGCKTMAASAHSSQVGFEECLLRLPMRAGNVVQDLGLRNC